eukprot:4545938-Pyramimonas_sp.AAC.1
MRWVRPWGYKDRSSPSYGWTDTCQFFKSAAQRSPLRESACAQALGSSARAQATRPRWPRQNMGGGGRRWG